MHSKIRNKTKTNLPFFPVIQDYAQIFISFYQDLESVKQRGSISKAAILPISRVIFGDVTISSSAEEHFLNAAGEGVTQVLDRVYHHTPINH